MKEKQFKIRREDLKQLLQTNIACIASDMITVEGLPVMYMYREEPDKEYDSGWRFFSGRETQEYTDIAENFAYYKINTIANYDPSIIPCLDLPIGTVLEKGEGSDKFVIVEE